MTTLCVLITMVLNMLNSFTALLLIKKYEPFLKTIKGFSTFNPWKYNALRLWFVTFSLVTSVVSFMINVEAIKTLHQNTMYASSIDIKFYLLEVVVGVMIFQYHMLLLMDRRR